MEATAPSMADWIEEPTIGFAGSCHAHLVGIAGSGMRSLADVLRGFGWELSGSDLNLSPIRECAPPGIRLFPGHSARHVPRETEEVIVSHAVPADNPELQFARDRGMAVSSYSQMLGRLGLGRRTVAVAGTHGKSTTTAMLAHLLRFAGHEPTVVCGATPLGAVSSGSAGRGELLLVEACEYRANFLDLRPWHAAILNVEPDHFDCYDNLEQIEEAFGQFARSLPDGGLLVVRHDCQSARRAAAAVGCRTESFGLDPAADWQAHIIGEEQGRFYFQVRLRGRPFANVQLQAPGLHNVLNAVAAAALASANGLSPEQIADGLGSFVGLRRRLEMAGTWQGAVLVDDYAHHPTEVTASLAALRLMFPGRRIWCLFQPHQASRTGRLLDELAASLQNADKLLVAEIFRAREGESRPEEVTAADLAQKAAQFGADVLPARAPGEIAAVLGSQLAPGDVLITLGAGDMTSLQPWKKAVSGCMSNAGIEAYESPERV